MQFQPYLIFNGRAEEAIEFHVRALGAKLTMMLRFSESPEPHPPGTMPEGWGHKIMHANFHIGDTQIMASDGCSERPSTFQGFSLFLAAESEAEADRYFNALADGGKVQMPLNKTFWAPRSDTVTDRFGVSWTVDIFDERPKSK